MPAAAASNPPARGIARSLRLRVLRFLLLGWSPYDTAAEYRVGAATVYRMASNLLRHRSVKAPSFRRLGRPRRLTIADEDDVLEILLLESWL